MIIKNIIFFICLFLISPATAKTDAGKARLKGHVKSITEIKYHPIRKGNAWIKGKSFASDTTHFNSKGEKTAYIKYSNGEMLENFRYEYLNFKESSAFCRKTLKSFKSRATSFTQKEKDPIIIFCKKHKKDRIRITRIYSVPKSASEKEFAFQTAFSVFDKKGRKKEEYVFNSLKELEEKKYYKFKKRKETISYYDSDGNFLKKTTFIFNPVTKTEISEEYDEKEDLMNKRVADYRNDMTLRSEEIFFYNEGEMLSSRKSVRYDSKGNKQKKLFYNADSNAPIYGYSYYHKTDKNRNWVYEKREKIIMIYGKTLKDKNESPKFKTRRILYFRKAGAKSRKK